MLVKLCSRSVSQRGWCLRSFNTDCRKYMFIKEDQEAWSNITWLLWSFECWPIHTCIWVRLRNCGCLVTWFCYHLIAKPGNKTAEVSWPDPYTLHWRHNERNGVSNHQPHDCSRNRLFRRRSKKTSKLRVTDLCAGNSPVTRPVTRKMFPFDNVIMTRHEFGHSWACRCPGTWWY